MIVRLAFLSGVGIWMLYLGITYFLSDKQMIGILNHVNCAAYYYKIETMCRREKVDAERWLNLLAEQGIEPAKGVKVISDDEFRTMGEKEYKPNMLLRQGILLAAQGRGREEIINQLHLTSQQAEIIFVIWDRIQGGVK